MEECSERELDCSENNMNMEVLDPGGLLCTGNCNCNSEVAYIYQLTTVSTLPGFWMRSAFTTWNTSTIPSVLQHSVALMREQNTPHRLTVSLHE